MKNELHSMQTPKLRILADDLRSDARLLQKSNLEEAMILYRLYRKIVVEIERRKNFSPRLTN